MRVVLAVGLFLTELGAQSVTVPSSGRPLVGFVSGPGRLELTPILGSAASATLGEPFEAPEGAATLSLAPRQQYALIEQSPSGPLEVWSLHDPRDRRAVQPITGAFGHANMTVFSPRGSAAAIYSISLATVQILTGLPGTAVVEAEVSTQAMGSISSMAVTDDGAVVAARNALGEVNIWSGAKGWRVMPWSCSPQAWSFVANSHELAMIDPEQAGVLLLSQADGGGSAPQAMAGIEGKPDSLAMTSDGQNVIAADSTQGRAWSIDLETGSVRSLSGVKIQSPLVTLRDGHTFLLSSDVESPLILLKVASAAADPVLLIHPGNSPARAPGAGQ